MRWKALPKPDFLRAWDTLRLWLVSVSRVVSLNIKFVPIEDARVPVLDRGFIFGDGV
jgi:hypothetical protein